MLDFVTEPKYVLENTIKFMINKYHDNKYIGALIQPKLDEFKFHWFQFENSFEGTYLNLSQWKSVPLHLDVV